MRKKLFLVLALILGLMLMFVMFTVLKTAFKDPAQKTSDKVMQLVSQGDAAKSYLFGSSVFKKTTTQAQWKDLVDRQSSVFKENYIKKSFNKENNLATAKFSVRSGVIDYQYTVTVRKNSDKWELEYFNANPVLVPRQSNDKKVN